MTINKRYKRSISGNLPFYISASILTIVALLMFYLYYIAGTGIKSYGDSFFSSQNLEDASFSTLKEIDDDTLKELEKSYDVVLEKEYFVNLKEDDTNIRVFKPNQKINLYQVIKGSDISGKDDVVISAGYAENKGISPGDSVKISGREFKVSGLFLRPDYLTMLENTTDEYKNIDTFFVAVMNEEEYDELFEDSSVSYKVIYNDKDKKTDFRKKVYDDYYVISYLDVSENPRVTSVDEQADMFIILSWIILFVLPMVTVALISIIIGRKVKSEQKIIGTLSALGYKKSKLMLHYSLLALIPGLIGGISTTVLCLAIQQSFGELCLIDYEPMQAKFTLPIHIAVLGAVIPSAIYMLSALIKVRKLLKNDTVELLNGAVENDTKTHRLFTESSMKVKRKFALRSLLANPGRTFVVILGIILGSTFISLGYMFTDCINEVGNTAQEQSGTFKNEYILNQMLDDKEQEGEKFLIGPFENMEGSQFSVMGVDDSCTMWNLETLDNVKANTSESWYASTLAAELYDLEKGDEFKFRNKASLEEHTVKISGIIQNDYVNYIVSSRENVADIMGLDASYYNGLFADKDLEIDRSLISYTVESTTFEKQTKSMLEEMQTIIYCLIILGAIICISAIYVSVNMMMQENRHNISMLKVLGFNRKRINSMILNVNTVLLIPGIIIGIIFSLTMMSVFCDSMVEMEGVVIPVVIKPLSVALTTIVVSASYFASLFLIRRKTDRIDMVESLKDNRE